MEWTWSRVSLTCERGAGREWEIENPERCWSGVITEMCADQTLCSGCHYVSSQEDKENIQANNSVKHADFAHI